MFKDEDVVLVNIPVELGRTIDVVHKPTGFSVRVHDVLGNDPDIKSATELLKGMVENKDK